MNDQTSIPIEQPEEAVCGHEEGQQNYDAVRQRLRARFEAWLDEVLADEAPPEGLNECILREFSRDHDDAGNDAGSEDEDDRHGDLLALWSAMTQLGQEVKLQSRTFKLVQESLAPMAQWQEQRADLSRIHAQGAAQLQTQLEAMDASLSDTIERSIQDAVAVDPDQDVLAVLMDLHDRLERGLRLCQQAQWRLAAQKAARPRSWWQRLWRRSEQPTLASAAGGAIEALEEGYAMTLVRLTEALGQFGITSVDGRGEILDPHAMTVVAVTPCPDQPEGTVLDVYQRGYLKHGEVIRPAKVKVAGPVPADPSAGDNHEQR